MTNALSSAPRSVPSPERAPASFADAPLPSLTQTERRRASDRRMIEAAMGLIAEKGVQRTSLAEIGLKAGYSRGLPAERFGTKLGLIEAMIDLMEGWFARRAPVTVGGARGLSAIGARVAAHVEGGLANPTATRVIYYLYTEASFGSPEIGPRMRALSQAFVLAFEGHLIEAQDDGDIPAGIDCGHLAAAIVGLLRGIFMQWVLDGGATDLRGLLPTLQEFVESALRQPVASGMEPGRGAPPQAGDV